jgi:3-oxoadipate enol-lactonase
METARVNGIDVCYDVAGEGPWIVLSHSLACDRTMWDEQMAMLTRRFRVLRYDTRGHGQSSAPPGPYTLDLLADDLKALLAHLGIERTHFAGLSMGGMIGQTFEIKYPGIFQTLVLCDTTSAYPASAAPIWNERIRTARTEGMAALVDSTLARWFTQPFRDRRADVMQRFAALISSTPVEGYVGCSQALVRINVRVPALVIVGEHDPGTPVAMARAIHEHLSGSELAVLPDAAHIANVEQPEAFNRALEAFLAANTPKSPPR